MSTPDRSTCTRSVRADGSTRIRETIVQDFGFTARHGIERVIPVRDGIREYRISNIVVAASKGTPDDVSVSNAPETVTIRIGDPDQVFTGVHAYRVAYDLDGLTESAKRADHTALTVDAFSDWRQSVDSLTYEVVSPGRPTTFVCQQGVLGSKARCASAVRTKDGATFRGKDLGVQDAFTVRMSWPTSVVAISEQSSVVGNADLLYALLVGLMVLLVGWRYRRRWVRLLATAQAQLWATFGPDVAGQQLESYDLRGDPAIEFTPPMGLRPGEVGALLEVGPTAMLTGTVVDLAARGAIRITESDTSWTLERRNRDVVLTDDEQLVLERLFQGADTTSLDGRGAEMSTLAGELAELQTDDLEDRGLAVRGTTAGGLHGKTHVAWLAVVGVIAAVAGAIAHGLVVTLSGNRSAAIVFEVIVVAVIILGVGAIVVGGAARGLTPMGIAAAWRVRGFDRFFTASEAVHARAAADQGLFRQYMGYAIVLGHVDRWVAAFDAARHVGLVRHEPSHEHGVHALRRELGLEPAAVDVVVRVRRRLRWGRGRWRWRGRRQLVAAAVTSADEPPPRTPADRRRPARARRRCATSRPRCRTPGASRSRAHAPAACCACRSAG